MGSFKSQGFISILKGIITSIVLTLILLFIFAIFLTYTNIAETTIPAVIIIITAISLLIGSSLANRKIRKNGVINGAVIGTVYLLVIYLISSITNGNFNINFKSIIMISVGILFGILGGIVGVNTKK